MKEKDLEGTPHTDLACERMRADTSIPGVAYREEEREGFHIGHLLITSDEGAEAIGKPKGHYTTLSFPPIYQMDEGALLPLSGLLSSLILDFCERLGKPPRSVLAVGLGNRAMTADAVGPCSIDRMLATRHLSLEEPALFEKLGKVELSLLAPGVLGRTGIEAYDLVKGAAAAISADLVLVIDALAARSTERLAATVQLSDTGIRPGSGVGNARRALDEVSLGVPVLSLGMPTVVNSSTLVRDAFSRANLSDGEIPPALKEVLGTGQSFFVSPRECDVVTERAAQLFGDAVNMAFSPGFFGE